MNDLGMTLAWLAVQVSLVLAPGLIAYALAARRGPAAGASVATLGLAMVVALTVAAFLPAIELGWRDESTRTAAPPAAIATAGSPLVTPSGAAGRPSIGRSPMQGWRVAWARFERGAAGPVARFRPWAGALAVLLLAGAAAGLLRLAIGLAAVMACRWRSRAVGDPAMIGLLDELRRAVDCRAAVELREADDLVGPAAAGWRRPLIFLPADWRSWDESERRAVLGHELAHVVRGDYAAGLIARVAVALNGYHPMVRWLAGRLRLQQELAADAIGAELAGSRSAYLVALSRLALSQDGRSPSWPARAFLPARGTLIRRIKMLRQDVQTGTGDRPWTRARRLATAALLLATTAAVMTLRGPARGGEAAPAGKAASPASRPNAALAPTFYHPGKSGVVLLRPAAAVRHDGVERVLSLLGNLEGDGFDQSIKAVAQELGIDRTRPGFRRLNLEDLDWITLGIDLDQSKDPKGGPPMHRIVLRSPAARTVAPFDWLAFLRQWRLEVTEVREGGGTYYRLSGPLAKLLGPDGGCVYLPDDRTIVVDVEKVIRDLAANGAPPSPEYLRGPDWDRARRGWLAMAINNGGGVLDKGYDLGRPDDAIALTLLKGVDRWIFSVDDADSLTVRAAAACVGGDTSAAVTRTVEALLGQARAAWKPGGGEAQPWQGHDRLIRMAQSLWANTRVERADRTVEVRAEGFGSLADLAALLEFEAKARKAPEAAKP